MDKGSDDEIELDNRSLRRKRSSILKPSRPLGDDVSNVRLSRRVSFSSNFIKPFMTDDDKNTIWDSTIEETIDNTESTHSLDKSQASKEQIFNTSLFVFEEDNNSLENKKNVIVVDGKMTKSKVSNENVISEATTIQLISLTGRNKNKSKLSEEVDKENIFVRPSTSAVVPRKQNIQSKIAVYDCGSNQDELTDMELTCQEAESITADNMESTCQNPVPNVLKANITKNFEATFQEDSLNFTCRNPLAISKKLGQEMDITQDMQLTCQNPVLVQFKLHPDNNVGGDENMEITCQNVLLVSEKSRLLENQSIDDAENMEFTCRNPILMQETLVPEQDSGGTENMEFNCHNPVWTQEKSIHKQDSDDAENMEFTCRNPVSVQETLVSEQDSAGAQNMEFSCQNPVLVEETLVSEQDSAGAQNMEFTCQNHVLMQKTLVCKQDQDGAENMEFSCQNPVSKQKILVCKQDSDVVENMEFTCQNPVLVQEMLVSEKDLDAFDNKKFTCQNPVLKRETLVHEKERDGVENKKFTCRNPVLMQETSIYKQVSDVAENMEFTCQNPVLVQETLVHEKNLDGVENKNVTCQNPVLMQETLVRKQVLDGAEKMEFTCQNPVLQTVYHIENEDADMNLTCPDVPVTDASKIVQHRAMSKTPVTIAETSNSVLVVSCQDLALIEDVKGISLDKERSARRENFQCTEGCGSKHENVQLDTSQAPSLFLERGNNKEKTFGLENEKFMEKACLPDDFTMSVGGRNVDLDNYSITCMKSDNLGKITCNNSLLQKQSDNNDSSMDDTQQLLRSASRINKSDYKNASATSMDKTVNVSRVNVTYVIANDCDVEQDQEQEGKGGVEEVDEIANITSDVKEQDKHGDIFSACLTAKETGGDLLDKGTFDIVPNEDSLVLAEYSFSSSPPKVPLDTEMRKTVSRNDSEKGGRRRWCKADYLAKHKQRLKDLEEYAKSLVKPKVPVDDKMEDLYRRSESLDSRHRRVEEAFRENLARLAEFQELVLEKMGQYSFSRSSSPIKNEESAREEIDIEKILPTLEEEIKERSKLCDSAWETVTIGEGVAKFHTLFGKMELTIEFARSDYKVTNFALDSLLTDYSEPLNFFLQREFMRTMSPNHLQKFIGNQYTILSLLDYVQMVVEKMKKYYEDIVRLEKSHCLVLDKHFVAKMKILNADLLIKWEITLDLSDLDNISDSCVEIVAVIGEVDKKYLQNLVNSCPRSIDFLNCYANKVDEHIESLLRRLCVL